MSTYLASGVSVIYSKHNAASCVQGRNVGVSESGESNSGSSYFKIVLFFR
jgi:hypothetical protein